MIKLEDVKKSYPIGNSHIDVLKGINLNIAKGEFVSIMGPSGSGKSTLAAILGCLSSISGGSYRLDNKDLSEIQPNELAAFRNNKIGYIFQDFNLLEGVTAVENVALPLVYAGINEKNRIVRAKECLELMGLGDRLDHTPQQLSGGQKQRVAIARALVSNPVLIFADEPTGALDAKTSVEIMNVLQKLNLSGQTVVQVTHSREDAEFSKRIITLIDGLIISDEIVENFKTAQYSIGSDSSLCLTGRMWQVAEKITNNEFRDLPALKKLFKNTKEASAFKDAAKCLVLFPGDVSRNMLVKLFRHKDWSVRAEIIKSINIETHDIAIGFLIKAASDSNAWVRFLAVSKLRNLDKDLQLTSGADLFLNLLKDDDERVRSATIKLVSDWCDSTYIDSFIEIIKHDSNPRVRTNAMEALVPFLDKEEFKSNILDAFISCLETPNHRVSSTAAALIYTSKIDIARKTLDQMLISDQMLFRSAAAWAIGYSGDSKYFSTKLFAMLATETESIVVSQLTSALSKMAEGDLPLSTQIENILDPVNKVNLPSESIAG